MAEVLRDYIKTLTPPKGGRTTSHALQSWDVVQGLCKTNHRVEKKTGNLESPNVQIIRFGHLLSPSISY